MIIIGEKINGSIPSVAKAIAEITPVGLSPNKQMVANFVKKKQFFVLTQLYRLKNRI